MPEALTDVFSHLLDGCAGEQQVLAVLQEHGLQDRFQRLNLVTHTGTNRAVASEECRCTPARSRVQSCFAHVTNMHVLMCFDA